MPKVNNHRRRCKYVMKNRQRCITIITRYSDNDYCQTHLHKAVSERADKLQELRRKKSCLQQRIASRKRKGIKHARISNAKTRKDIARLTKQIEKLRVK